MTYALSVAMVEVYYYYNESLRDLLAPEKKKTKI